VTIKFILIVLLIGWYNGSTILSMQQTGLIFESLHMKLMAYEEFHQDMCHLTYKKY